MTTAGFYEQKTIRPGGLALVVALHAAAFAGLVLVKTDIVRRIDSATHINFLPTPPTPPAEPPPPPRHEPPQHRSVIDAVRPLVPVQSQGPQVSEPPEPPTPPLGPPAQHTVVASNIPDLPHTPVRLEAQFDPRFASQLQPPYPPAEEAAQHEGTVRVRLTIGADGRVKAIERISATSDAFWRATERHALARWRFRPATVDGRPVESTKVMNLTFRIDG